MKGENRKWILFLLSSFFLLFSQAQVTKWEAKPLFESCGPDDSSRSICTKLNEFAKNNELLVSVTNERTLPLWENLAQSALNAGVDNFVSFFVEGNKMKSLSKFEKHLLPLPFYFREKIQKIESKSDVDMLKVLPELILWITKKGYNVLYADVDVFVLSNPFVEIAKLEPHFKWLLIDDGRVSRRNAQRCTGTQTCPGIFYAKPGPFSTNLLTKWSQKSQKLTQFETKHTIGVQNPYNAIVHEMDPQILNDVKFLDTNVKDVERMSLDRHRRLFRKKREREREEVSSRGKKRGGGGSIALDLVGDFSAGDMVKRERESEREREMREMRESGNRSVGILPCDLFVNGHRFNEVFSGIWWRSAQERPPVMVHNNWITTQDNKIETFKRWGMWMTSTSKVKLKIDDELARRARTMTEPKKSSLRASDLTEIVNPSSKKKKKKENDKKEDLQIDFGD